VTCASQSRGAIDFAMKRALPCCSRVSAESGVIPDCDADVCTSGAAQTDTASDSTMVAVKTRIAHVSSFRHCS
jgi:hypothetical protein